MDLSDLRIFRAVVEEGGITRAAKKLHRVQSNVTTRIRQLEDDLGTRLFIRDGKKLYLSGPGRTLLDYSERLLSLAEEARAAVQDPRPQGLFRLGSMESTAAVRLPGPLTEFYSRYPDVELQLRTGNPVELSAAILSGEIDAALVAEPVAQESFESIVTFEEDLVIAAKQDHPPIDADSPVPPTMIAFEHGCPHRRRMEAWYEWRGAVPTNTIELSSYHAMFGCIVAGMGVALVPKSVLASFPERHRLSEHALPPDLDKFDTLLIWRRGAISPNIEALKSVLEGTRAGATARSA